MPWAHLSQASAAHPAVAMVSDDGAGEVVGSPFPVGPVVRLAPGELCLVNNLISMSNRKQDVFALKLMIHSC